MYNTPLDFFREEQFADELAKNFSRQEILGFIRYGYEAILIANTIMDKDMYEEYQVTQKQLEFDVKAVTHNLKQLRRALELRKKEPIQDFANGFSLFLN